MLLLDEPTRGVDVGSKAEIYRLIGELAAAGQGGPVRQQLPARAARRLRPAGRHGPRPAQPGPAGRRVDPGAGHGLRHRRRRGELTTGNRPMSSHAAPARRSDSPVALRAGPVPGWSRRTRPVHRPDRHQGRARDVPQPRQPASPGPRGDDPGGRRPGDAAGHHQRRHRPVRRLGRGAGDRRDHAGVHGTCYSGRPGVEQASLVAVAGRGRWSAGVCGLATA